jgi:hypothetical protein
MHGAASVAFLFLTLTVLCPGCIALPSYTDGKLHSGNAQREDAWNATVNLDLGRRHPIPTHLFGLFFEEIGHAGKYTRCHQSDRVCGSVSFRFFLQNTIE